ncbi:MAG TPA: glycosyltransferase family 1 protein [Burkholderiaceae bacterium]|nr:glycosyltransferase family 1 protein [Burkholderiaceae bacterium]
MLHTAAALDPSIVVDRLPSLARSRRIAIVTETYPPEVNGVAMSIARIVEGLQRRSHELQLVRPRQRSTDTEADAETAPRAGRLHEVLTAGWPIPRYPNLRMGAPSKRALVHLWSLQRPDVVHIATVGPLGWSALHAARHLKLPVSSDFRTNFHAYGQHYRIGWLAKPILAYLRKFHNRAQCTMVPTDALRAQLAASGFERLAVVSRGVDTRQFDPRHRSAGLRRQWGAGDDDLVLAYVGRLAAEKNLGAVLAAHDALRGSMGDAVKLVFVGDGPMRAELAARCPQAVFAGQRGGEDLAAHFASADLFLFPSLTETFGNVTIEAMASGLPVVAFDCAAAAQCIQSGRNGLLAHDDSLPAFVRATLTLAADRERLRAMGAAARESARAHDWDGVVARFEAVLAQTIDRFAPAPQLSLRAA